MQMMNKIAVGTDIIEVARVRKSCTSPRFTDRVFSQKEREMFSLKKDPAQSMAGNWAAKEAFAKALGTGVSGFALHEVSCLRDEKGCPYLELSGSALDIVRKNGLSASVSISHTKDYATAVVILYKE